MVTYWAKTPRWLKMIMPKGLVWEMPAKAAPAVYITFDDGPHPAATPFALEQLRLYGAKATFFCVGNNVAKFPTVYQQVLAGGHTTANHTYNHMNGWKTANNVYLTNVDKAAEYIESNLFRPPYGKVSYSQARALQAHPYNMNLIMWDVLSGDFDRQLSPEKCLHNVLRHIRPGSIVLFHDSEKAWDRMSYALPRVLEHCRQQGWAMEAITAMP